MNPSKVYYGIFFTLLGMGMMAVPITDYVTPGFYNYDMCSKNYMDKQGHPNIYDRTNSQELINACYSAKTLMLNPILESLIVLGVGYSTIRYMILGSKTEFLKNNPNPKWRWEDDSINNEQKFYPINNCGTCRYEGNHQEELENHLRLTGHKRQNPKEVSS